MKKKKGFTLIEIIVCITLISIIGITSTIVVIKTRNKSSNTNILNSTTMSTKLSNITNKILEAANVYIAVEKDGNGNTYETGIKNGGKGLYIKVQTLVDSGYLDKSILNNLTKETDKKENELQLLAVDAVNTEDSKECNNSNAIEYTVNWSNNDKPIYLCPYDNNKEKKNTILNTILNEFEQKGFTGCKLGYEEYNGICLLKRNGQSIYYYTGYDLNNHAEICWKDGNIEKCDKVWIVRTANYYEKNNDTYENKGTAIRVMQEEPYIETTKLYELDKKNYNCIKITNNNNISCFYMTSYDSGDTCGNIIEYIVNGDSNKRKITIADEYNIEKIWIYTKGEQSFTKPNQTNTKWNDMNIVYDSKYKYETPAQIIYRLSTKKFNDLNIPDSYIKQTRWYHSSDITSATINYENKNRKNSVPTFPDFDKENEKYYYLNYGLLNIAEFAAINNGNTSLKFYNSPDEKKNYLTFDFNYSTGSILQTDNHQCMASGVANGFYLSYTIDSDLLVCSGDGTKDKPYIIKDKC